MPRRVAVSTLNASTVDILNVIRENASAEYQDLVPKVQQAKDIPKVGEVLYGYPAMANQFLSALMNRIAAVRIKSATFNNPFVWAKKGFLDYGETVEEIFVNIAKVRAFSYEKAEARELKRSMPDIRSAFHIMNWNVQYPVTVTEGDLHKAFLSMDGVQDLIARIVDSVYRAAEYDEYLLFKYLMIAAGSNGEVQPVQITGDTMEDNAVSFRTIASKFTFMSNKYNAAKVMNATSNDKIHLFLTTEFAARYGVEVLASAFNINQVDYPTRVHIVDSWTDFDNERFAGVRAESDMLEELTADQLALMANVQAFLVDEDWFQVYDNLARFTEKFVAAGDYWNYFYRIQKTISYSPFANAVMFVNGTADIALPATITGTITEKDVAEEATVLVLDVKKATPALNGIQEVIHNQDPGVTGTIAVTRYGAYMFPKTDGSVTPSITINGTTYTTETALTPAANVGDTIEFTKPTGRARSRKK